MKRAIKEEQEISPLLLFLMRWLLFYRRALIDAQFVVTDVDRETVIDDVVYSSMRSGDHWRRNPDAHRLFLVLNNISDP